MIANLAVCQRTVWLVEFEIQLYFDSLSVVMSCQIVKKKFDYKKLFGDSKSNCMPKINLIAWVWNFTLFWQLISCYELSSCHKLIFTSEIDWGITNPTVCQKSDSLVEFENMPYFLSLSVVTSCQVVRKKFWLQKWSNGLWI